MGWADQRSRIRAAAREAHIEAEIARIEAAPSVVGSDENGDPWWQQVPHDPALAAQFAHLHTETFRRPEGWVPFGDEVPPPPSAA